MILSSFISKFVPCVLVGVPTICLFLYLFPLGSIDGNSMFPTLRDKQLVLCKRLFRKTKLKEGKIYAFKSPSGSLAIKRLDHVRVDNNRPNKVICFMLGDNADESYDSREYGYINAEDIVAQLIWQITK